MITQEQISAQVAEAHEAARYCVASTEGKSDEINNLAGKIEAILIGKERGVVFMALLFVLAEASAQSHNPTAMRNAISILLGDFAKLMAEEDAKETRQ
jgi:hypothetical protein